MGAFSGLFTFTHCLLSSPLLSFRDKPGYRYPGHID